MVATYEHYRSLSMSLSDGFEASEITGKSMDNLSEKPSDWPVVLSIHGIRTTADWQRKLNDVLIQHSYRHVLLGFGFFGAIFLLMPWSRARKVEWFREVYSEMFTTAEHLPSVIAHSFGSYIVTKAMLKDENIRFDRMIICGSIISRKYPWSKVLIQRKQASKVLHEASGRDLWARLVEWVVFDAGSSGVSGFDDLANGRVAELIHERHQHSDYFNRINFERRWVPFLRGEPIKKLQPAGSNGFNYRFAVTISFLLAVAAVVIWFFAPHLLDGNVAETVAGSKTELGSGTSEPKNPSSSNAMAGDLEKLSTFFRGEWLQSRESPEITMVDSLGMCYLRTKSITHLKFERVDNKREGMIGHWFRSSVSTWRFEPKPNVREDALQKRCRGTTYSGYSDFYEEQGDVFVSAEEFLKYGKANINLKINDCIHNGKDCHLNYFGLQERGALQKITFTRFRIGEMMFEKQPLAN